MPTTVVLSDAALSEFLDLRVLSPSEVPLRKSLLPLAMFALAGLAVPPQQVYAARPTQVDAARSGSVTLQHQFARGQTRTLRLTASQTVESVEGPAVPNTNLTLDVGLQYEVQSVQPTGAAQISATLSPTSIAIDAGPRPVDTSGLLNSMRSTRLSFQVSPSGTFSERTGVFARDPSRADTGSFMLDLLSMMWIQFPQEPVEIGESWLQTTNLALGEGLPGVQAMVSVRYTLVGYVLHGGREKLLFDATYSTIVSGSESTADTNATTLIHGRGAGQGHVIYDPTNGTVAEIEARNGLVMSFTDQSGARSTEAITQQWTITDGSSSAAAEGSGAAAVAP